MSHQEEGRCPQRSILSRHLEPSPGTSALPRHLGAHTASSTGASCPSRAIVLLLEGEG